MEKHIIKIHYYLYFGYDAWSFDIVWNPSTLAEHFISGQMLENFAGRVYKENYDIFEEVDKKRYENLQKALKPGELRKLEAKTKESKYLKSI